MNASQGRLTKANAQNRQHNSSSKPPSLHNLLRGLPKEVQESALSAYARTPNATQVLWELATTMEYDGRRKGARPVWDRYNRLCDALGINELAPRTAAMLRGEHWALEPLPRDGREAYTKWRSKR